MKNSSIYTFHSGSKVNIFHDVGRVDVDVPRMDEIPDAHNAWVVSCLCSNS